MLIQIKKILLFLFVAILVYLGVNLPVEESGIGVIPPFIGDLNKESIASIENRNQGKVIVFCILNNRGDMWYTLNVPDDLIYKDDIDTFSPEPTKQAYIAKNFSQSKNIKVFIDKCPS